MEGRAREGSGRLLPQGRGVHERVRAVGRRAADSLVHVHRRLRGGLHPHHAVRLPRAAEPGHGRDDQHERLRAAGHELRGQEPAHQAHPRSAGGARPQQRQHDDQGAPGMGSVHLHQGGAQEHARVDQEPDPGRGAGRGRSQPVRLLRGGGAGHGLAGRPEEVATAAAAASQRRRGSTSSTN